jgi:hypothetical protein
MFVFDSDTKADRDINALPGFRTRKELIKYMGYFVIELKTPVNSVTVVKIIVVFSADPIGIWFFY